MSRTGKFYPPLGDWADEAVCRGLPTGWMFPEAGDIEGYAQAKEVCAQCPVRDDCLDYAINNNVTDGIWGGLGEEERQTLRRKRQRAARAERRAEGAA